MKKVDAIYCDEITLGKIIIIMTAAFYPLMEEKLWKMIMSQKISQLL